MLKEYEMRWPYISKKRSAKELVRKLERKEQSLRCRSRVEYNIKIEFTGAGLQIVDWTQLAWDRDQ
jgi:hypothetical protein